MVIAMKYWIILSVLALMHSGCGARNPSGLTSGEERKDRAFFAQDGIQLGQPETTDDGHVFVPITFQTEIIHSGQWLYDIDSEVKGDQVLITAIFSVPPKLQPSIYMGGVTIPSPQEKTYKLLYLDPSGTTHPIGKVISADGNWQVEQTD